MVPLCPEDGEVRYGSFDAKGVSGKTQKKAPEAADEVAVQSDDTGDESSDIAGND